MLHERLTHAHDHTLRAKVAVLVDGENVASSTADLVLSTAEEQGRLIVRRVYGDMAFLRDWETDTRFHQVHTGHGRSKNTADISMVIEAMDLAHSGAANAFVIVSSDGDFAPLATRLREAGHYVFGMGTPMAARSFRNACSEFFPILPEEREVSAPLDTAKPVTERPKQQPRPKLSGLDAEIHRVVIKNGGVAGELRIVKLGNHMPDQGANSRKSTGCQSWRSYLHSKPDLYLVEGTGQDARVRLVNP